MNKRFLILGIILILAIVSTYIFIPSQIKVANYTITVEPSGAVNRLFESEVSVKKWWPGQVISDVDYHFQGSQYKFTNWTPLFLNFNCEVDGKIYKGTLRTVSMTVDSTAIQIEYEAFPSGKNPIQKVQSYLIAKKLRAQVDQILSAAKNASDKMEIVYGLMITPSKVKDSSLISTKKLFATEPTNKEIHDLILVLKNHIKLNAGVEKDYPMLNIRQTLDHQYEAMVAIPLEKDIPSRGDIVIKKMVLGNILVAKVQGGFEKISLGQKALKNYADDFNRKSPAIPFQSLVTDRFSETDSSKWITYLKYPVF